MTKPSIPVFHLVQLKEAVEEGRDEATVRAKKMFGLNDSASKEKVLQTIEDELDLVVDKFVGVL